MYVVAPRFDTRILIVTCQPVGLQCAVRARVTDQCRLSCVAQLVSRHVSRARTAISMSIRDPIHAMAPMGMGMAEHLEGFGRQRGCSTVP
jgi:hypothetical protein